VELRTEDEQIAAIKNWWKQNGSSLLIGIGAALAIVFGWQAWQSYQADQRSVAGAEYRQLLEAAGQSASDERAQTITYIAGKLQDEHEDSPYAVYATLILASHQFDQKNDPEAAAESLQWVQSRVEDGPLTLLVRGRLARAQFAAGEPDEALDTLGDIDESGAYKPLFAELEGDILRAQGDLEGAREAYLVAREATTENRNPILELKMADMAIGEGA
jgi:predicted negative regulator of RcsB-dependent stress response